MQTDADSICQRLGMKGSLTVSGPKVGDVEEIFPWVDF